MKIKSALATVALASALTLGVTSAQEVSAKDWSMDTPAKATQVQEVKGGQLSSGKVSPFKSTYVFGSVGSTMNGKSSTVTTIGVGQDLFKFVDGHVILGVEGALTHFTGKRLNTLNNEAHTGFATVDKKNMLELGAKLSYQFNETTPLNVRLYGKAGVATTTLKKASDVSPFVAVGTEFNVNNSNFVWFAEVKHYTDLRKAKVYYAEDRGSKFNTRKDNTTMAVGLQYRF